MASSIPCSEQRQLQRSKITMLRVGPCFGQLGITRHGVRTVSWSASIEKWRICSVPTHSGFQATSTAATSAREDLLADAPDLTTTLAKLESLQTTLGDSLRAASDTDAPMDSLPGDPDQWRDYAATTEQLRMRIDQLAAGRSSVPLLCPPLPATREIRSRLGPRQRLLSFCLPSPSDFTCGKRPVSHSAGQKLSAIRKARTPRSHSSTSAWVTYWS